MSWIEVTLRVKFEGYYASKIHDVYVIAEQFIPNANQWWTMAETERLQNPRRLSQFSTTVTVEYNFATVQHLRFVLVHGSADALLGDVRVRLSELVTNPSLRRPISAQKHFQSPGFLVFATRETDPPAVMPQYRPSHLVWVKAVPAAAVEAHRAGGGGGGWREGTMIVLDRIATDEKRRAAEAAPPGSQGHTVNLDAPLVPDDIAVVALPPAAEPAAAPEPMGAPTPSEPVAILATADMTGSIDSPPNRLMNPKPPPDRMTRSSTNPFDDPALSDQNTAPPATVTTTPPRSISGMSQAEHDALSEHQVAEFERRQREEAEQARRQEEETRLLALRRQEEERQRLALEQLQRQQAEERERLARQLAEEQRLMEERRRADEARLREQQQAQQLAEAQRQQQLAEQQRQQQLREEQMRREQQEKQAQLAQQQVQERIVEQQRQAQLLADQMRQAEQDAERRRQEAQRAAAAVAAAAADSARVLPPGTTPASLMYPFPGADDSAMTSPPPSYPRSRVPRAPSGVFTSPLDTYSGPLHPRQPGSPSSPSRPRRSVGLGPEDPRYGVMSRIAAYQGPVKWRKKFLRSRTLGAKDVTAVAAARSLYLYKDTNDGAMPIERVSLVGSTIAPHKADGFEIVKATGDKAVFAVDNPRDVELWLQMLRATAAGDVGTGEQPESASDEEDLVHTRRRGGSGPQRPSINNLPAAPQTLPRTVIPTATDIPGTYRSVENPYTFVSYVSTGTKINLMVAIDFTVSNGDYRSPKSLHHNAPDAPPNEYLQAIMAVGDTLRDYTLNARIPVFGFGGKPTRGGEVSHCFPVNGNVEDPTCEGFDGVIHAYGEALDHVELSAPTNFTEIFNVAVRYASGERGKDTPDYWVLLLLTDGEITEGGRNDFIMECIDTIVVASGLPLSVIIIGVGEETFEHMGDLESRDAPLVSSRGDQAQRRIVEFVPFSMYKNDAGGLSRRVLGTLPAAFLEYMALHQVHPRNRVGEPQPRVPPPRRTPVGSPMGPPAGPPPSAGSTSSPGNPFRAVPCRYGSSCRLPGCQCAHPPRADFIPGPPTRPPSFQQPSAEIGPPPFPPPPSFPPPPAAAGPIDFSRSPAPSAPRHSVPAAAAEIPFGWEERETPTGRKFWVDHTTRTTHWELPRPTVVGTEYPEQMAQLRALGADDARILRALRETNGNVELAAAKLFEQ